MWLRKAEMRRLLAQLAAAQSRAEKAEERLDCERLRNDRVSIGLINRFMTSQVKTYAVAPEEEAAPQKQPELVQARDPFKEAEREEYGRMAIDAGNAREDGYALWDAKERGERMPYEMSEQVS